MKKFIKLYKIIIIQNVLVQNEVSLYQNMRPIIRVNYNITHVINKIIKDNMQKILDMNDTQ